MKNYIVVRNLVANPRTPLDLGLGSDEASAHPT